MFLSDSPCFLFSLLLTQTTNHQSRFERGTEHYSQFLFSTLMSIVVVCVIGFCPSKKRGNNQAKSQSIIAFIMKEIIIIKPRKHSRNCLFVCFFGQEILRLSNKDANTIIWKEHNKIKKWKNESKSNEKYFIKFYMKLGEK